MKNSKTKKDDIGVKVGSFKVEVELTWKQLAEMREGDRNFEGTIRYLQVSG